MRKSDSAQGAFAGLFAAAADLGANPAMLVVLRVPVAFVRAEAAGEGAGFEQRANEFFVGAGSARRNRSHGQAEVGAIEIKTNALPQLRDAALSDAGVGAGNAALSAIVALFDTAYQRIIGLAFDIGVRSDDLFGVHGFSPAVWTFR
jgi:hypothetical protein